MYNNAERAFGKSHLLTDDPKLPTDKLLAIIFNFKLAINLCSM
jgi:hypothetical protein